jgi:Na+-driven multidrug efflux pump
LGLFIALLFPSAVSLPGSFGIQVLLHSRTKYRFYFEFFSSDRLPLDQINNRDSMVLLIGSSIGEIGLPVLFGELYFGIGRHFVNWGCLIAFFLMFCIYLIILIISSCSRTLTKKQRFKDLERRTLIS